MADLRFGFGTFMDFPADDYERQDTRTFDAAHPDHPRHSKFRWRRQNASTFFWMLAKGDPSAITEDVLPELHRSLFDACAAVRYDIAMCLGHTNHPDSAVHLRRLIEDGAIVRDGSHRGGVGTGRRHVAPLRSRDRRSLWLGAVPPAGGL